MSVCSLGVAIGAILFLNLATVQANHHEGDEGFISIFNPQDLSEEDLKNPSAALAKCGWTGIDSLWRIEDNAITGQTTTANPTRGNTFLVWRHGEVDNFELKLQYKIVGGNSGIQYRSKEERNFIVAGYQADIDSGPTYSGINYHERGRGILAKRGEKTVVHDGKKQTLLETFADSAALQEKIRNEDWNDYHIIARGRRLIHKINGHVTCDVTDRGTVDYSDSGILALQLHAGPPMKVQFRNIRMKRLKLEDRKKVVVVAGRNSHGRGSHEFLGGCQLVAKTLNENMRNISAVLYTGGWPKDPTALANADAVLIYSDGAGGHPTNDHLEEIDRYMKKGVGLACVHFAVEPPMGKSEPYFLNWLGGYYKLNWSVNPHWVADFTSIPEHPVTRGVEPFKLDDEWYFHMKFRDNMEGVTPLLSAVAPAETMKRKDGGRSGNPTVREKVAAGESFPVAWAYERPDGGRSFGLTGGHYHWSWSDENFRQLVLNAVVWIAKAEVPEAGVPSTAITRADLEKQIGYKPKKPKS